MIRRALSDICFKLPVLLGVAFCAAGVQAQAPVVQVPFVTSVLGIPTSTYNGTTAGTPCANGLTVAGDGCPGTQAPLWYPYSVAVDSAGDLVTASAAGTQGITVLYEGGSAMAALLVAAKPNFTFNPTVGTAYFLNYGTANLALSGPGAGSYYCNGVGTGTIALDKYGNGCPSTYADAQSRAVTMDPDGNIFFAEYEPIQSVRVIYAGGVRAANLIKAYNPTVTTPQVGFIYALSSTTGADFVSMRGIAVQPVSATTENVFVADNGASATATAVDAGTNGNQLKEFVCPTGTAGCNTAYVAINGNKNTAAGWVTYILGTTTASSTSAYGDGGVPSLASVDDPTCLQVDRFGNLFIGDVADARIRVVYNGGSTPPLYVEGLNSNASVTPTVGDIYTVVGGASSGSTVTSPAQANLVPTGATNFGLDAAGNLYFTKSSSTLWVESAATGIAVNAMWAGAHTTTFSASTSPAAGVACNGTTGGPAMTDAYADGCPATEVDNELPDFTPFVFDTAGNFYMVDARVGTAATAVLRKYTYGNQFGLVPVGSTVTATFAFTPSVNNGAKTYTPVLSFTSPEYTDAGGDNCTTETGVYSTQTCTYSITFKPTRAGQRPGTVTLSQTGTGVLDAIVLGGIGAGAQVALDPAAQSIIGTGLVPAGVAVDTSGNAYIADTTTGNVYKSTAGGAPVSFATGLKTPAQIAVNGAGTLFIADKGNNRIASVTSAGGAVSAFLPTTFTLNTGTAPGTTATLSGPSGVAVDLSGNTYISDTGNNRVIEVITPQGGSGSVNVTLGFTGLSSPGGLTVDASGDVFVADTGNARVVELSALGVQSNLSITPSLSVPVGVTIDAAGNLYIADSSNQTVVLVPFGSTTGNTLLGSTAGLTGLAVDNTGDVFISAAPAGGLLELNRTAIAVAYPLTNVGATYVQTLTVNSTGTTNLTTGASLDAGTDTIDFLIAPATTNGCTVNETVVPGASCNLAATFQPQSIGKFTDTVTLPTSSAINAPTAILTGTGAKETPTTTALSYATVAPVTPLGGLPIAGDPFNVTATITLSTNVGVATGSVLFTVDGSPQKAAVAITVVGATVSATTSLTLTAGPHSITALYSGDNNYAGSSASLSVTVVSPQTTKLTPTYALGTPGAGNTISTILTATLTAPSTPVPYSGTVTFVVDTVTQTPPATVGSATGVASITMLLAAGSHTVCATYAGTSYYLASTNCETFTVVTGTSSLTLAASPTGTITFGTPVTITATTVTGNSSVTPTGSIILVVNGQSQTFPYAASVAVTYPLLVPGKYTVTASYTGDSNYAPAQQSLVITVIQSPSSTALLATPTVTVAVTNNITTVTTTITLTATVGPAYSTTYPTKTVTFLDGATPLGTAVALSSTGTASFVIPSATLNALTSFAFTAAYSGDSNYLPSTISPPPTFSVGAQSTSLTLPQNAVVADELSLVSFYNYAGTVKLSCSGLPANSTCSFAPASANFAAGSSNIQQVQLQIFTDVPALTTAGFNLKKGSGPWLPAIYLVLSLCFGLAWKRHRGLLRAILSVTILVMSFGLSSCASDTTDNTVYLTPTGTYAVGVVATDGTTTTTTNLSVTVIPGATSPRP